MKSVLHLYIYIFKKFEFHLNYNFISAFNKICIFYIYFEKLKQIKYIKLLFLLFS